MNKASIKRQQKYCYLIKIKMKEISLQQSANNNYILNV
jgi:hypothetical protein